MGGEAKDPRERKGTDGWVVLLGRSHQGRPEAEDTLMMITLGDEISIAGGGADEKQEENRGLFFSFFFLHHVFVVKYKKRHGGLAMAETKL